MDLPGHRNLVGDRRDKAHQPPRQTGDEHEGFASCASAGAA